MTKRPEPVRSVADKYITGLWRHPEFLKLWSAQTISGLGTQITILAIPIIAVTLLDATAFEMGLLAASISLPSLLFGLPAGAWLDRRARRPVLIASDVGRALLLLSIPAAHYLDALSIGQLYFVAFLFGLLNLLFIVAYRSFLPTLILRSQLVEGNSKLEMSRAGSEIIGPGVAGLLIRVITAPVALIIDAATYLISAWFLRSIRAREHMTGERAPTSLWTDIREGLAAIYHHQAMRALAACAGTIALFNGALEAIFILYIVRELDIGPGLLGLIFSAGGIGFLAGPVISARLGQRFSARSAIMTGIVLTGLSDLLIPLAGGPRLAVIATLTAAQFLFGIGYTMFSIVRISAQQGATPDELQGRTHATMAVLLGSGALFGGLLGGVAGEWIGLRPTLVVAAIGELASAIWILRAHVEVTQPAALAVD